MNVPCTPWVFSCFLGMLSIPIMGCAVQLRQIHSSCGHFFYHLEYAGVYPIRHCIEQRSIRRDGQCAGHVCLRACCGTVLQAGSQKLTATFTPSDTASYSTSTATVELTVTQASPVITWAPLSAIQQGAALSTTQLDATANVPGTFSYNPAAGAVLPAGTQQLAVMFRPSNTADYISLTAYNTLTVNAGSPHRAHPP